MAWARYTSQCQALKIYLAYELNRMIPVQFISNDANYSERLSEKSNFMVSEIQAPKRSLKLSLLIMPALS